MHKKLSIFFLICFFASVFAQEPSGNAPERLAVHVSGASDDGINKSLSNKLLAAAAQSGRYVSAGAGGSDADFVCEVSLAEAFGEYSIFARLARAADSQELKTASLDRSLKSLDDITRASNELARQLFGIELQDPAPSAPAPPASAAALPVAAAKKECEEPLNLNELVYKIKEEFPNQLKDCSGSLAKKMAVAMTPFGKKEAAETSDPPKYMVQCVAGGLEKELPGAGEYVKLVENFVKNILGGVSAGGKLDPKGLLTAVGNMNVNKLLEDINNLAAKDECVVDEPYEPPAKEKDMASDDGYEKDEDGKGFFSLGFRSGFNFSHLHYDGSYGRGDYGSTAGFQAGMVFDFAISSWFHLQPGIMYIQKGAEDERIDETVTLHYLEFPLLVSLKFSALRLNVGPYYGRCVSANCRKEDFGMSYGLGFDIGMFYLGVFYDYGLLDIGRDSYNRTLGFNLGVNL